MQDIDFDELDRAVSSVLGTAGQVAPAPVATAAPTPVQTVPIAPSAEQPATATATPINHASSIHVIPTVTPRVISNVVNTPPPLAEPVTITPTEPPTLRRSNGRFMDVVHPSSNMRPSAPVAAPVTAPVQEAIVADVTPPPAVPETIVPVEPDLPTYTLENFEETETAPLETPFLTDAKVEKRPLGAFSPAETEEEVVAAPKPPVFEPALEISEEVLIGADETDSTDPQASTQYESASATTQTGGWASPSSADASAPTQPVVASISQQYTEQVATTEPSGSIFDTESYHQPLAHPQKKKSGLYIVLWVIGLAILGGGLGLALYYFVLRTL